MKKEILLISAIALFALLACNSNQSSETNPVKNGSTRLQSVSIDQGNIMLESYLNSTKGDDTALHCLIFNADSLRNYLNDTSRGTIENVKIMFAHTPEYIQKGGKDKNCGYTSGELTVIIAGYDNKNNYVYTKDNRVMDHSLPCPYNCPKSGSAANDLLSKR